MTSYLVVLCLSALLLIPNITQVPEVENSTRPEEISFGPPLLMEKTVDISRELYTWANTYFSKVSSGQLISMDVKLRQSRIRKIANKAAQFFKQVKSY